MRVTLFEGEDARASLDLSAPPRVGETVWIKRVYFEEGPEYRVTDVHWSLGARDPKADGRVYDIQVFVERVEETP